jgi:hypothetical protein
MNVKKHLLAVLLFLSINTIAQDDRHAFVFVDSSNQVITPEVTINSINVSHEMNYSDTTILEEYIDSSNNVFIRATAGYNNSYYIFSLTRWGLLDF